MEFIKVGKNYMIKNSNGRIITEKEKLQLENNELIIKDFKSKECQGKTTAWSLFSRASRGIRRKRGRSRRF